MFKNLFSFGELNMVDKNQDCKPFLACCPFESNVKSYAFTSNL